MNKWLPRLGVLALGLVVSGAASAQSALLPTHAASQYGPAAAPPPPSAYPAPAPPSGRWVSTAEHGWIWAPAGATAVNVDGVPYVYLYTPTNGWTWYLSPWGWGPFHYGVWVNRPWHPHGTRVWVAPRPVVVGLQNWR